MDNILTDAHASRGPSGSGEWGNCAGSVRAQAGMPDRPSIFAELGTGAHELFENCIKGKKQPEEYRGTLVNVGNPVQPEGFIVDDDMIRAVQVAVDFVNNMIQQYGHLTPFLVYSERKVDPGIFTGRIDMWGTSDLTIIAGDTIYSIDYKHGQGVVVEIDDDWQTLLYIIGVLADLPLEMLAQLKRLVTGIIQPRAAHRKGPIRTREINLADIPAWVEFFRDKAARTDDPNAPLTPGTKQCKFCKAKPCTAMANTLGANLGLASQPITNYTTPEQINQLSLEMEQAVSINPDQLTPLQLRAWLDNAAILRACVDAVEAYAQEQLKLPTAPPELTTAYKLVNKDTHQKFVEMEAAELIRKLTNMGFKKDEVLVDPKVRTPNQIRQVAKAAKFSERKMKNLESLIHRPTGGLTIAPISDSRPAAMETTAEEMFGAPIENATVT